MSELVSPFTSLQQGTRNMGHYRELSGVNKVGVHHGGRNDYDYHADNDNNNNNNNNSKFSLSTS